jgi:hypothetical protein
MMDGFEGRKAAAWSDKDARDLQDRKRQGLLQKLAEMTLTDGRGAF